MQCLLGHLHTQLAVLHHQHPRGLEALGLNEPDSEGSTATDFYPFAIVESAPLRIRQSKDFSLAPTTARSKYSSRATDGANLGGHSSEKPCPSQKGHYFHLFEQLTYPFWLDFTNANFEWA